MTSYLLLPFFLVFASGMWAQVPVAQHFNTQNGLPSSEVYEIAFEDNQRIWFATDRGPCQYNGYELRSLHRQGGPTTVLRILTDPHGRLWFSTLDGSLSYWEKDRFHNFAGNDSLKAKGPVDGLINRLWWEPDGRVFVRYNAWGRGHFLLYQGENGQKTQKVTFSEIQSAYPTLQIGQRRFIPFPEGWMAEDFLIHLTPSQEKIYFVEKPNWKTLVCLDRQSGVETKIPFPTEILRIRIDPKGRFLVACRDGLHFFDPKTEKILPRVLFPGKAVTDVAWDQEGIYYMSFLDDGVYQIPSLDIDYSGEDFKGTPTLFHPFGDQMLIGTLEGELWTYTPPSSYRLLVHNDNWSGRLSHLAQVGDTLFIGKYMLSLDGEQVRLDSFAQAKLLPILEPLPKGLVLLAGQGGYRVLKRDSIGTNFSSSRRNFHRRVLTSARIRGEIWLGTLGGLYSLSLDDYANPEQKFPEDPRVNCRINHIEGDDQGGAWLASVGNGLFYVRGSKVQQFSEGLNSLFINQLHLQDDSTLWVAGNRGLNRVRFSKNAEGMVHIHKIEAISVKDGLPDNFVRAVSTRKGQVWVSGQSGLAIFHPEDVLRSQLSPPTVVLEEVSLDTLPLDHQQIQQLDHDQNNLTLRFASNYHFRPLNQTFYRYRLDGSGSDWFYTNNRQVSLYDLPPGQYRFEVEARNREGIWSEKPATFSFEIAPHFSQTRWFQGILILGLLAGVGGLFALRLRQIRRKEKRKRELQAAQLRAQEAELTILRNQMNPHFVFNALNAIQSFIFEEKPERANYYLGRFSRLMRDALQFSSRDHISLAEEIRFIETYLELESIRFPGGFNWSVDLAPEIQADQLALPPFLVQPLLENSVKHAFKGIDYEGKLEVHFKKVSKGLLIVVRDNGRGLQKQAPRPDYYKSMGLEIVRNRIQLINEGQHLATFELKNRSEKGSDQHGVEARIFLPDSLVQPS